jgi:hypothetical protein
MKRAVFLAVTLAAIVAVGGCEAHLPRGRWDASARRVCTSEVCYGVGALDGEWRMVHQESASAGWYNARVGGVIETNATCRDDVEAAPLAALTRELLVGYSERRVTDQALLPMLGREGLRTRIEAKLDGVPMRLEIYVIKRNGCVFDIGYAAPPDRFDAGEPAFTQFAGSFTDGRTASADRGGS